MTSVFTNHKEDFTKNNCFFGNPVSIARFDKQKHPIFEKLTSSQLGFFWKPEEVDLSKDGNDFKNLTDFERHIFTSNLKRQILLDSVQGRAPTAAFSPICSLPELENWIQTWAFSETIHSRSYTHIIRNVYPDPSIVFDEMMDIEEIVDCAKDISYYYDRLIEYNFISQNGLSNIPYDNMEKYNHKKALWLTLASVNILEGVRFYVSFACSWAFAELKKMEGNAKIIKLICRDENLHLAGTQHLLKILTKEDPDFAKIAEEEKETLIQLFKDAADQEKAWADYLFKDGSIIGLNAELLKNYVEFITNKRMVAIGLRPLYKSRSNPLPWTENWISGKNVQVAPQQTQITSYIIGNIKKDITTDTFKGFKL
jgi:ribonucleoside-diphosphate reductase beta chain